jgi:HAD superfamily hydrolase (TIGR01509 family)
MKLKIPAGAFRAYLFDCDGTIADSMPLHYIAWKKALAEWNCPFDEDLFYAWGGKPPLEIITELSCMHGLQMPVEEVAEHKENYYYDLLPQLQPVAEVLEHIDAMHGRVPFAVVSGSSRESVTKSLSTLHLLDKFDILVGSEDYEHSKPAPDAFLIAAARLGIAPGDCLVFEDTDLGIQAATAAGMASVRVPSPLERRAGTAAAAKA